MTIFDENMIRALMRNAVAVQEFPFLTPPPNLPQANPRCHRCKPKGPQPDYNAIKATAAALPPDRQRRLLQLAGVSQQATVVFRTGTVTQRRELG